MGNFKVCAVHTCVKNKYDNMPAFSPGKYPLQFSFGKCQLHSPSEKCWQNIIIILTYT